MKRCIILLLLFILNFSGFSQIDHIKISLGKTDKEVARYFDSLLSLKTNPYYKVKKSVNDKGDLILSCDFAMSDEGFFNCLAIIAVFTRIEGVEYCTRLGITGSAKYAQSNLNYIKDNFDLVSDGKWEYKYPENPNIKAIATFERKEGPYPTYIITYDLVNVK